MHNARMTLELESSGLELAFFVNNISNTEKKSWVQRGSDGVIYAYDRPRWIGGSIRKTF
jgi:outer membrane receptor protein involved in Fe transport